MAWVAILSYLLLATAALAADSATEIYVSPAGNDGNPGTKDKPLATSAGARGAVRKLVAAGLKAPVTVYFAGGTYDLSEPLVLGPEDSGTEQIAVTWAAAPGQKVVLSGGTRIAGWAKGPGELWQTTVPRVKEGKRYFRQLWVDGSRAVRARTPNADANQPCLPLRGAELTKDPKTYTYRFPPGVLKEWGNLGDVEAVVVGEWEITRKIFKSVDVAAGTAEMAGPHAEFHPSIAPVQDRLFFIENAFEALDGPGEWYLNRQTGVLSYWPKEGEDLAKAEVIAPRLTRLLELAGTPDKAVRNLHFQGLSFHFTDWAFPRAGYGGIQACHFNYSDGSGKSAHSQVEAAILWNYTDSCSFEDCEVAHLGGCGIELAKRCTRDVLQGNRICDISGNGVMLGGPKEEADVPKDCRILNNLVYACGRDYYGSVGIWVGFAQRTLIAHNELHEMPYTGISIGWQWDPHPTPARENTIEYNHIHDVMRRVADGGGIYTLGFQPGSVLRGNHIHDVRRSPLAQGFPSNGVFMDEGSKGFTLEDNLIHDTPATPIRFHQAIGDVVRNNTLVVGKAGPAEYNATPKENVTLENNTLVEAGKEIPANDIAGKAGLEGSYREKLREALPARP